MIFFSIFVYIKFKAMSSLLEAIISREDCSMEEAELLLEDIREEIKVRSDESPEDVLFEFGFEPDYLFDVI